MACEVDLRGAVLDGKRGDYTGRSKPTGNRRGFLSVSDSAPRSRPTENVDARLESQNDIDMAGPGADATADTEKSAVGAAAQFGPHRIREGGPIVGTVGKVSGRKWKIQQTQRTSISNSKSSIVKKSYEERMKARELKRKFQERKEALKEDVRANKRAKREEEAERKKRKEENEKKSLVVQKITNPKSLKKMSRKQRRTLITYDEDAQKKKS